MTRPHVIFVCWGNICRSPMAAQVARRYADDAGVDIEISSAGVSAEELGNPIDPRAARTLREHDYPVDDHTAHQIDAAEIRDADLVIAMEDIHLDRMARILGEPLGDKGRLLTDFDPAAEPGSGVPDPWYGGQDGFESTLATIEAAMPGIVTACRAD